MLTYLAIARRYCPKWLVWENVPGVLSSNGGRDFGTFLRGLGELGYGFAYRVLDAQYVRTSGFPRAVPQRRRRVFVVGHLGDWRRAAAVLFEPEGMQGHPPPRREAGQGAPTIPSRSAGGGGLETDLDCDGGLIASTGDVAHCLNAGAMGRIDYESETMIAHSLRSEGFDASKRRKKAKNGETHQSIADSFGVSRNAITDIAKGKNWSWLREDGTGRGTPLVPVAFHNRQDPDVSGDVTHPLGAKDNGMAIAIQERAELRLCGGDGQVAAQLTTGGGKPGQGQPVVAFDLNQITSKTNRSQPKPDVHHTLPATACPPHLASPYAVRRLTPTECERLQGFPDGWTRIPYRNKPADKCPDGPRYKALGNSWAINCGQFIFDKIKAVEEMA